MLQSVRLQRVRHDLATELQQQALRDEDLDRENPAGQYKYERFKIAFFFSFVLFFGKRRFLRGRADIDTICIKSSEGGMK